MAKFKIGEKVLITSHPGIEGEFKFIGIIVNNEYLPPYIYRVDRLDNQPKFLSYPTMEEEISVCHDPNELLKEIL